MWENFVEEKGWILKKESSLAPRKLAYEWIKAITDKMEGRGSSILAHYPHFCLGREPKRKAMF
jgi:hypothetical protein